MSVLLSAMSGVASPESCSTRQDLLRSLIAAVDRVLDLGAMEVAAAVNRESFEELDRIGRDLNKALQFKDSVLDRYKSHVLAHRCK